MHTTTTLLTTLTWSLVASFCLFFFLPSVLRSRFNALSLSRTLFFPIVLWWLWLQSVRFCDCVSRECTYTFVYTKTLVDSIYTRTYALIIIKILYIQYGFGSSKQQCVWFWWEGPLICTYDDDSIILHHSIIITTSWLNYWLWITWRSVVWLKSIVVIGEFLKFVELNSRVDSLNG